MKKLAITLTLFCTIAYADANLVPAGYRLYKEAYGDLNGDGIDDRVVIIRGTNPENIQDGTDENLHGVMIFFGKGGGYQGICPSGWHISTSREWSTLRVFVEENKGCYSCAAKYLKTSDWGGEDTYGFSALPGGGGGTYAGSYAVGLEGFWWSTIVNNYINAYSQNMDYNSDDVDGRYYGNTNLFSVRCLQE